MEKYEPYSHLPLYTKSKPKWIIDLTRAKPIKLQEGNRKKSLRPWFKQKKASRYKKPKRLDKIGLRKIKNLAL